MTVLVIIGLMSSAVVMTMPKDIPASQAASDALLKQFNQAAQTSILSGETAAFGTTKDAYAFYSRSESEWVSASQIGWPSGLSVDLTKDGEPVKLTDKIAPLILFEPTGSSSVFTLTLSDFDGLYVLSSNGDGRVSLSAGQ